MMNTIAPVHVRFDANVRKQMIGVDLKQRNNNINKKPSNIDTITATTTTTNNNNSISSAETTTSNFRRETMSHLLKSRSFSPVDTHRRLSPRKENTTPATCMAKWCPPPKRVAIATRLARQRPQPTTSATSSSSSRVKQPARQVVSSASILQTNRHPRANFASAQNVRSKPATTTTSATLSATTVGTEKALSSSPDQTLLPTTTAIRSRSCSACSELARSISHSSKSPSSSSRSPRRRHQQRSRSKSPLARCSSLVKPTSLASVGRTCHTRRRISPCRRCASQESFFVPPSSTGHIQHINSTYTLNRGGASGGRCCSARRCALSPSPTRLKRSASDSISPSSGFVSASLLAGRRAQLFDKLGDCELGAGEVTHQANVMLDFWRRNLGGGCGGDGGGGSSDAGSGRCQGCRVASSCSCDTLRKLEQMNDSLRRRVERLALSNRDLKLTVHQIINEAKSCAASDEQRQQQRRIDELEIENDFFKRKLAVNGNEKTTHDALNMEKNALKNLKTSLEDNRAHLRRQLVAKEAEISRLNVQLRNMNRQVDKANMEIELLRESNTLFDVAKLVGKTSSASAAPSPSTENNKQAKQTSGGGGGQRSGSTTGAKINAPSQQQQQGQRKNVYNLSEILSDPIKTRLYIDKLNIQIRERDAVIKNLNEAVLRKQEANDQTATSANAKQEEASSSSSQAKQNGKLNQPDTALGFEDTSTLSTSMPQVSQATTSVSKPHNTRMKRDFSEMELNNVRSRLQERINELEPLPELLRASELKLHEANIKLKYYEAERADYKKLIKELRAQNEASAASAAVAASTKSSRAKSKSPSSRNNDTKRQTIPVVDVVATSSSTTTTTTTTPTPTTMASSSAKKATTATAATSPRKPGSSSANGGTSNKNVGQVDKARMANLKEEFFERKMQSVEEDNDELIRQLAIKDEFIRDLTAKLNAKSNEAASFRRQLDIAIADFKVKEQQLVEKFQSKERSLQLKCTELESRLGSVQLHSNRDKRDKEEINRDYLAQMRDLKERLEQTQVANKQMQEYIAFLKKTYSGYFGSGFVDTSSFGMSSGGAGGGGAINSSGGLAGIGNQFDASQYSNNNNPSNSNYMVNYSNYFHPI